MNDTTAKSTQPPVGPTEHQARPEGRGDTPGPRSPQADHAERLKAEETFKATARRIVTQLDHAEVAAGIEASMWQLLRKEPER